MSPYANLLRVLRELCDRDEIDALCDAASRSPHADVVLSVTRENVLLSNVRPALTFETKKWPVVASARWRFLTEPDHAGVARRDDDACVEWLDACGLVPADLPSNTPVGVRIVAAIDGPRVVDALALLRERCGVRVPRWIEWDDWRRTTPDGPSSRSERLTDDAFAITELGGTDLVFVEDRLVKSLGQTLRFQALEARRAALGWQGREILNGSAAR